MRRLALWSLIPLAAVVAAGSIWWLGGWHDARHWPIRWLEVSGELERLTAAQVRAAVAEQARRGFFAVNVEKARVEVEALPWVEQAAVSRHWPDALRISVRERRAVARWNDHALIGRDGELFEVAGTSGMQGLTGLYGPDGRQSEVFDRWQQIRARLVPEGLEIRRVEMDPRGAWRLELNSGLELLLGREEVSKRLERFMSIRAELRGMSSITSIDLRYPNGLALTRDVPVVGQLTRSEAATETKQGAQPDHG